MTLHEIEFMRQAPDLRKADVVQYLDTVQKNGPFIDEVAPPDSNKSNERASNIRKAGNRFYYSHQYTAAMKKYNKSICYAEVTNSEDLAIGYANRSAIYYNMEEYELALANIALAKKYNYPKRLMSKLRVREHNCKQKISNGNSHLTTRCPSLEINVPKHPMRPFMAADIVQEELPTYGRSLVAVRPFEAGDVILHEKAWIAAISPELKYKNCSHCSTENFHSLIPCPNCVSVMYCSEKCLEEDFKYSHRFECGITEKLHHIARGDSRIWMGSRAFFYGLTVFNDNMKDMIDYCEANGRNGADPFTLDYSNYNQLEEFKVFHKTKLPTKSFPYEDSFRFLAAVYHSVYIKHPLVRSLVTTKAQENFMLRSIFDYMRITRFLNIGPYQNFTDQLFSIGALCNHSCVPNTMAVVQYNQLKFIVLRPIAAGKQIEIAYGWLADESVQSHRSQVLTKYYFNCICDACEPYKRFRISRRLPTIAIESSNELFRLLRDNDADDASKLNALRDYANRYRHIYPRETYVNQQEIYRELLQVTFLKDTQNYLRTLAAESAF